MNAVLERRRIAGEVDSEIRAGLQTVSGWREVRARIESGMLDVDARDDEGSSLLMLAVLAGNRVAVEGLLALGAEVDAVNRRDETPLHLAAGPDSGEIYALLLDAGAPLDARDDLGRTPLMWSVGMRGACYGILVQHGADHRKEDMEGMTALQYAWSHGHVPAARFLESLEREPSMVGWAARHGHWAAVPRWVARGEPISAVGPDGKTALIHAVVQGRLAECKALLDAGADPMKEGADGNGPLHHAARHGHLDLCRVLLERLSRNDRLFSLTRANRFGNTPSMLASMAGHQEVARLLESALQEVRKAPDRLPAPRKRPVDVSRALSHYAAELGRLYESEIPNQIVVALANHRGGLCKRITESGTH